MSGIIRELILKLFQVTHLRFQDYNECLINNGDCSQNCTNLIPGYVCNCELGYTLDPDGFTCIPNANCSFSNGGEFRCVCLPGFEDVGGDGFNCTGKNFCV